VRNREAKPITQFKDFSGCISSLEPEELRAGGHRIGDDEGSARDGWQDFENDSVR
jgi:hypothetical protein